MNDGGMDKGRRREQERKGGGGGGFGEGPPGRVRVKKGGLELRTERECQTRRDGGTEREG